MSDYEPTQGQRDRVVGDVLAYAASEGLSELGKIQAAVHLGMKAGVAAERERVGVILDAIEESIDRNGSYCDCGAYRPIDWVEGQLDAIRADDAGREANPLVREPVCAAAWPGCVNGEYNPACCRWPKSCSVQMVPATDDAGREETR